MNNTTACSLDCYDACEVIYDNGKLKGVKGGHTQGFLCPNLNHYDKHEIISKPRYMGKEITLDEALEKLKDILLTSDKNEILHYRGHGNFALMQEVTDHFFASYGATLTDGSLCDGAGEAGIIEGRGTNKNMSISEIAKSEVVIFWGRDPHTTSSHLLPLMKDKTIIVIDPVKTKIAKMADIHVQIKPHGDLKFAMLLSRFLHIEDGCDEEYLEQRASEFEEFYELTQTIRIKAALDEMNVTLGDIGKILEFVKGKKVAIVCGVGIQKYRDGADVIRAIDAFGVALGLFGKEGCGVAYLGSSRDKIISPFNTKSKKVSKVDTKFENFKTLFIQGANPLSQMPDSLRVKESIKKVQNIIYFGLYENESSEVADLIIPAKSFLCKNDVRTSYSHNEMIFMNQVKSSEYGISEYDLSAYLCNEFDIEIKDEDFYLNHFKSFKDRDIDEISYKNGFDTDTKEFIFLEEFESNSEMCNGFFLITPKNVASLNSQFSREKYVYLHSSLEFIEGEEVIISSKSGTVKLEVKYNDNLLKDCILIYSGTRGVNNLTSSKHSYEGKNAIYQENKVEISRDL